MCFQEFSPLAELQSLHEATVGADEIDGLGHMNVRFYGQKASRASRALMAELGLDAARIEEMKAKNLIWDVYTRYINEQLEGARLAVRGGVLEANNTELSFYLEMINRDSGDLAAAFLHRPRLVDQTTHERMPFPPEVVAKARRGVIAWPQYGQPRSIGLDPPRSDLTLDQFEASGLVRPEIFVVDPEECDAYGFVKQQSSEALAFAVPQERRDTGIVPHMDDPDGRKLGWATMEARQVMIETPRVGDKLKFCAASMHVTPKIHQFRIWTFNAESGRPMGMNELVHLAFDIGARRSIEMPPEIFEKLSANCNPDLV